MSENRKCEPCESGCHSATDAHIFINIADAEPSDRDFELPAMVNFVSITSQEPTLYYSPTTFHYQIVYYSLQSSKI